MNNDFQSQVINVIGPGDGTALMPGLQQFAANEFAAETDPTFVIVTPFAHDLTGLPRYPAMVGQIQDEITRILPWIEASPKNPFLYVTTNQGMAEDASIPFGKVLLQFAADAMNGETEFTTTECGITAARARVWSGDQIGDNEPLIDKLWIAWDQQFTKRNLEKRQACAVRSRSSTLIPTTTIATPTSITSAPTTSSSLTLPPAQTVTSNCEVCVLPPGSNDPFCTPLAGCTPTTPVASPTTSAVTSPPLKCTILYV